MDKFGGNKALTVQKKRDNRKNIYCAKQGFSLFRIGSAVNKNHYRYFVIQLLLAAVATRTPMVRFVYHGKAAHVQYVQQITALTDYVNDIQLIRF